MNSEKLKNRKYPSAISLANGEKEELPKLYDSGMTVKQIAEHYFTTTPTVIKALVLLGYDGPKWAVDAVKRFLDKGSVKPSNMKRVSEPLI